jgi:hypothetical protein
MFLTFGNYPSLCVFIKVIKWRSPTFANDVGHPNILVDYLIEVVISHFIFHGILVILSMVHPRQMIVHNISTPFIISDLNVKLLEKKDPTNQSWFGTLLSQKILDCHVISVNNDIRDHDVRY